MKTGRLFSALGMSMALASAPAMATTPLPYFGYFANGDHLNENYDHINVEHIWASIPDRAQATSLILSQLATAKSHGVKVVLSVDPFLFSGVGTDSYGLEPSASVYWQNLVDALESHGYLVAGDPIHSTVIAFYPVDEPDLHGLSDVYGVSNGALRNAINVIHVNPATANFPVAAIVSSHYTNMLSGLRLFDWVGMDNYHLGDSDFRNAVAQLESYLDLSRQHVILVPQAFLKDGYGDYNNPDFVFGMAEADPHVNMILAFLWKHDGFTGTGDIPALKTAYTYIGRQVKDSLFAQYVSESVPSQMNAGQSYTVTVKFKNIGQGTWLKSQAFNLGSQNPGDNDTWGLHRVHVASDVAPGQTATFSFNVTAPSSTGQHNFQWRMVDDGVAWFGPQTPNVSINVVIPPTGYIYGAADPCTIYAGQSTCTSTLHWSSNRSDAEVWVYNADGSGGQLFARAQSGTQAASWITTAHTLFRLRSGAAMIATADVYGLKSSSPPPGGGDPCPLVKSTEISPNMRNCP